MLADPAIADNALLRANAGIRQMGNVDYRRVYILSKPPNFCAAFGLGAHETAIATVDADGVALAAIQGLNQKLEQQLKEKESRIEALERNVAELKQLVARLASVRDDTAR